MPQQGHKVLWHCKPFHQTVQLPLPGGKGSGAASMQGTAHEMTLSDTAGGEIPISIFDMNI
jgi:hypothetical protein